MGRSSSADRSGMGSCGTCKSRPVSAVRGEMAVDSKRLRCVPGILATSRRDRRVQRKVDERPVGAARVIDCNVARSFTGHLPEFLSVGHALAVHRNSSRIAMRGLAGGLVGDVVSGLLSIPKTLPPKLFYDERGAALFEQICELPEYYLTRSELEILWAHAHEIATLAGPDCALIEYGSGAGVKVRLLLDAMQRVRAYVPVDISRHQLADVARSIALDYPALTVQPVCADYTTTFSLPSLPESVR